MGLPLGAHCFALGLLFDSTLAEMSDRDRSEVADALGPDVFVDSSTVPTDGVYDAPVGSAPCRHQGATCLDPLRSWRLDEIEWVGGISELTASVKA